jgi:hypothetical protein
VLSPAELASFDRNGFVLARAVIPPAQAARQRGPCCHSYPPGCGPALDILRAVLRILMTTASGVALELTAMAPAQAARTAAAVWEFAGREAHRGLDFHLDLQADEAAWYDERGSCGFKKAVEVYHAQSMWDNTTCARMHALFAQIYGTAKLTGGGARCSITPCDPLIRARPPLPLARGASGFCGLAVQAVPRPDGGPGAALGHRRPLLVPGVRRRAQEGEPAQELPLRAGRGHRRPRGRADGQGWRRPAAAVRARLRALPDGLSGGRRRIHVRASRASHPRVGGVHGTVDLNIKGGLVQVRPGLP